MSPFNRGDIVLPKKDRRAKAKLDRLSFREPGDLSARERKEHLQVEIKKLQEKEKSLANELEGMRNKYVSRTETEELERSFVQVSMKTKDMKISTRELCDRVGNQVDETKRAFIQALAPRAIADPESKKASEELKKLDVNLSQKRRDLKLATLRLSIIDYELAKFEKRMDSLQELRGRHNESTKIRLRKQRNEVNDKLDDIAAGDSKTGSSEEIQEPANILKQGRETKGEEVTPGGGSSDATADEVEDKEGSAAKQAFDISTTESTAEGKAMNEIEAMQSLGAGTTKSTQQQQDQASDDQDSDDQASEYEELESKEREDHNSTDPGHTRIGNGESNGDHERNEDPEKKPERMDADPESAAYELAMMARDMRDDQDREALKFMEKQIKQCEEKIKKNEEEKCRYSKERDSLKQTVAELRNIIQSKSQNEKQKGVHHSQNEIDEQWQAKKREDRKQEVDKNNRLRSRAEPRWWEPWGFAPVSDDDDAREKTEKNHLQSLLDVIDGVEALESRIREVRRMSDEVDNAVDWRIVLERELDLERLWLESRAKRTTASVPTDDSSAPEARDHFSTSLSIDSKFYKTLKDGEVRLLVLWPAKADHYPLLCTLETSTWDQGTSNPKYAALSYFWGSDTCNGRLYLVLQDDQAQSTDPNTWGSTARYALRIPIRNNLFRALLRLRRSDKPVSLWIDVICIDQANLKEKTKQLEQMVKIYQNAENVCVWLGESDNDGRSDQAMVFIKSIMDFAVLDRYAHDHKQAMKWFSLAELMRDRWFSRRWVVQEISLAREATVYCGNKTVQWPDFADAVSLLASNQETIKGLFDYSEWRDGPNTLGDVQSFGAYILLESTNQLFLRTAQGQIRRPVKKLESLVTSLKTFDVTDQKDLVYSLVSIASDTPQGKDIYSDKVATTPLTVDYERPPDKVYKDFTKFCIRSSKSLDVLCRPWGMPVRDENKKIIDLPSWIPMLSQSEFGNPEDVYNGRKNGENLVGPVGRPRYKASGEEAYDIRLINTDKDKGKERWFLPIDGFKLAKIKEISPRTTGGVILRDSLKMGGWNGIDEDTASVPDNIWRTLVADRDSDGQIPPMWYQRACLRCLEIAGTFNNGDLNIGELLTGNSDLLRRYLTRVRSVTWNRRFFNASTKIEPRSTEKAPERGLEVATDGEEGKMATGSTSSKVGMDGEAELFGLGPPDMANGDYVCILIGCSVPVVLRDRGQYMQLIGECYAHGKMEGEAMEDEKHKSTYGRRRRFKLK
ncbi:hypothetical protein O1611_g3454 [Lasiodiplodia mahajangana]|uniref:Uncharacterized protein n=1 Tax=Lasiodiplodia mahajangana TaxID=1108764 RepID=A0ACC2JS41_9PEZI|nr:hypothetical protein O1611_g3454 [Lasiodiplodia mahajangana]